MNRPLISIAPMLDVTNRHFRYFMRLITSNATLWTQMLHSNAIIRNPKLTLQFNPIEQPLVLQLGGSNPKLLSEAAKYGKQYGYRQINLNIGCPSDRVQQGSFGACLMKQKQVVSSCMKAIKQSVGEEIECTVKCRLGVDQFDSYEFIRQFIEEVSTKGLVKHFIIHARKAHLSGLSPKQNRNIPPLKYEMVYKYIQEFPKIKFSLNGGIKTVEQAKQLLNQHPKLEGCMLGRTAYKNPYQLVTTDNVIYGANKHRVTRCQILQKYGKYVELMEKSRDEVNRNTLIKPILHLFAEQPNSNKYRQILTDHTNYKYQKVSSTIRNAYQYMMQHQRHIMMQHQRQANPKTHQSL